MYYFKTTIMLYLNIHIVYYFSVCSPKMTVTCLLLSSLREERKWQKDKLQLSYRFLIECLLKYQKAVKPARAKYFSGIIAQNAHSPQILFNTVNTIINPVFSVGPDTSANTYEMFLKFIIEQIDGIRSSITPSVWWICSNCFCW